jgi:6-phosphogluconolactonase
MTSTTRVYVSNAESGDVRVYALDMRDGSLAPLQTVATGPNVMPMALSPGRDVLYAVRRSEPMAVLAFSIDRVDGRLSPLGQAPLPASMCHVSTDRTGRWLFTASYGGSVVAVSPIGTDGAPEPATQVITTPPKAHCILAGPDNRHVYATSLGSDQVLHWHFDAAGGVLTPAPAVAVKLHAGAGPRHFVFHPDGRTVYLLGELDGSITQMALDGDGAMRVVRSVSALPPGFSGEPWGADLHLTPDARFLYASERRASVLAMFRVDAASGALEAFGHVPTEKQPRGFHIDPSGRFLVAAGQASDGVAVYAIDDRTGTLRPCGRHEAGRDPNWVEIVELAV